MRRYLGIAALAFLAALTHITVSKFVLPRTLRPSVIPAMLTSNPARIGIEKDGIEKHGDVVSSSIAKPPSGLLPSPQFSEDPTIESAKRLSIRVANTYRDMIYISGQADLYNRDSPSEHIWKLSIFDRSGISEVSSWYYFESLFVSEQGETNTFEFEDVVFSMLPVGDYVVELAVIDISVAGEFDEGTVSRRPISIR